MRRMSMLSLRHMSCTRASIIMSSVKWNPWIFAVVENDMTFCPNETKMQFRFCVHLFGRMRRNSFFLSFQRKLSSIIQYLTA